jgi:amidase
MAPSEEETMAERKKSRGHLRRPSAEELCACAARDYLEVSTAECEGLLPFVDEYLDMLDEVEELPELRPPLRHAMRDPGREPRPDEDPYNAFTRLCRIEGTGRGPLAGKRVGVKDNIAVAGVPLTNGSRTLSSIPSVDAVVVERILDAGGTIVGKLNLDDFSSSGYGDTSFFGATRNPRKPTHSPGGSSSGAGSAVASGAVDVALGADQGGSVRIPAAMCGCVGIKATHGLVPSFGITYMDHTLDSIGPLGATVEDVAALLAVIAGHDWRDPQWVRGPLEVDDYRSAVDEPPDDLRIGVVREALDESLCAPAVVDATERAIDALRGEAASVELVSIPLWRSGFAIWASVLLAGWPAMIRSDGMGYGHFGYVDVPRVHATALVRRQEANLFSPFMKLVLLVNTFVERNYFGTVFAKAQNQRLALRRAVDEALAQCDLLLTPTVPHVATGLPAGRLSEIDALSKSVTQTLLTCQLNATGHPALALPSGTDSDGLPTSVQIIGRQFDERRMFRAAFALERLLDVDLKVASVA